MTKSSYEVEILINGSSAKEYRKDGKTYIEGRQKQTFSLRIQNHSSDRILAIPTIDGLSVLDGKHGSYDSGGYVIKPFSSTTIHGWRTSDKEVAEFYFSGIEESYASKMSKGGNQGVIGVAIYKEKVPVTYTYTQTTFPDKQNYPPFPKYPQTPWQFPNRKQDYWNQGPEYWLGDSQSDATINNQMFYGSNVSSNLTLSTDSGNANFQKASQELGTGFGKTKRSEVETVTFNRDDIAEIFTIYYNTRSELEKLGIDFRERVQYIAPRAFPGEYCEPPRK